jgi:uncharacterized protein YkwD
MLTTADISRPLLRAAATFLFAFGLIAAPAGAAQGAAQCPGSMDVPSSGDDLAAAAGAIVCLVNIERTSRGQPALRRDGDLSQAARGHASNMARHNFFAHVNPDGDTLSDRLRKAGYGRPGDGWRAGENLGWGTGDRATPNSLVDAWLASPGHRRILLSGTYREIGVGVAGGAPSASSSGLPGATYTMDLGTIVRG